MENNELIKILQIISEAASNYEKVIHENQNYHDIGTIEQCRLALERQKPKRPIIIYPKETTSSKGAYCPICNCQNKIDFNYNGVWVQGKPPYCSECGQKINWLGID